MSEIKKLLIFGTGTLGELAGYYFRSDTTYELQGYVDDAEFAGNKLHFSGKPVWSWEDACARYSTEDIEYFVAIGYRKTNTIRQNRYEQIKKAGYRLTSYVSSKATVLTENIGDNCFILENNVLQPYSVIGNNVTMWSGNHLGHHSVIENNVFITSHVVISGKCRIGVNSFLGVNSCLHDGVTIGERSVVGAGSIITESCEPRSVFQPIRTLPRVIRRDIL